MVAVRKIEQALQWVSYIVIFTLALLVSFDVMGRFFNIPIRGAYEIGQLLLVVTTWTGLAYVTMNHGHISVDILVSRLSHRHQTYFEILACLFGMAAFAILFWSTMRVALTTLQLKEVTDTLILPTYPIRLLLPVGAFLAFVELSLQLVEHFTSLSTERSQAK